MTSAIKLRATKRQLLGEFSLMIVATRIHSNISRYENKKSRYAVDRINQQGKILNSSRLSAQIEKIPPEDSFHASKRGENA